MMYKHIWLLQLDCILKANYVYLDGTKAYIDLWYIFPCLQCCIDNSLEMANILILNGADLNTRDVEGWTPLHAAAACGNLQIINLMVDSGADLVALNHDDKMPVDVGCDADIQYILQQKMLEAGE